MDPYTEYQRKKASDVPFILSRGLGKYIIVINDTGGTPAGNRTGGGSTYYSTEHPSVKVPGGICPGIATWRSVGRWSSRASKQLDNTRRKPFDSAPCTRSGSKTVAIVFCKV